ncbi:hypothetical protein FACHB389_35360 [Nostoc calcicola FACHB-389]|nr:hypothetical protein FACHB389_35360 [Nostoc calcicola FACHB-389]
MKIRFRNSFNNANASSCGEAFATFDLVVADVPLVLADVLVLAPLRLLLLVLALAIAILQLPLMK